MVLINAKRVVFAFAGISTFTTYDFLRNTKSFTLSQDHVFNYKDDDPIATSTTTNRGDNIASTTSWSEDNMSYLTMYGTHQADTSFALLPQWLQTYFEWHSEQTQKLDDNTKYIVLGCLGRCGGVSDRLRPLPFYLLYASLVPRVICIHWSTPFGLENYLLPPVGNSGRVVDWRCPSDVSEALPKFNDDTYFGVDCRKEGNQTLSCYENTIKEMQMNNKKYVFLDLVTFAVDLVNTANEIFQLQTYAREMPPITQWQFVDLMGDIFRVMFEPVLALTERINYTMASLGLKENEYVSVHVRSRYPINSKIKKIDLHGGFEFKGKRKERFAKIVDNAVNCASYLAKNTSIYFASDNHEVVTDTITRDILVDGGFQVHPVGIKRDTEPLHSNAKHPGAQISDFYSIFEDLLIMGGSKCVVHGLGSFGAFGAGLSGNRCRAIHRKHSGKPIRCPNDRTDGKCQSISQPYGGKLIFGTVTDGKRRLSSPVCK